MALMGSGVALEALVEAVLEAIGGGGGASNFSFKRIAESTIVTIPDAQQMIVIVDDFIIEGELILAGDGELFLLEVA